jgi:hypothetical protein
MSHKSDRLNLAISIFTLAFVGLMILATVLTLTACSDSANLSSGTNQTTSRSVTAISSVGTKETMTYPVYAGLASLKVDPKVIEEFKKAEAPSLLNYDLALFAGDGENQPLAEGYGALLNSSGWNPRLTATGIYINPSTKIVAGLFSKGEFDLLFTVQPIPEPAKKLLVNFSLPDKTATEFLDQLKGKKQLVRVMYGDGIVKALGLDKVATPPSP